MVLAAALASVFSPSSSGLAASGLELSIARAELPATGLVIEQIKLSCAPLSTAAQVLNCDGGELSARLPAWGTLRGKLRLSYRSSEEWTARVGPIDASPGVLTLALEQRCEGLKLKLSAEKLPVERLLRLAKVFGLRSTLVGTGAISGTIEGNFLPTEWKLQYDLIGTKLTLNEPTGRYATEALTLKLKGTAGSRAGGLTGAFAGAAESGQAYVEPVFSDFNTQPLAMDAKLSWSSDDRRIEVSSFRLKQSGSVQSSGALTVLLDQTPILNSAEIAVENAELPGFLTTYIQPFLAGMRLEGSTGTGVLSGALSVRQGKLAQARLVLDRVSLDAPRLGTGLQTIRGEVHWSPANQASSRLAWTSGRVQKVPIGASAIEFRVDDRNFALLKPWRQPILDGALEVKRLRLNDVGQPGFGVDFEADVEPIDLTALCDALGWPRFSGQLSGRLPGLTLRDQVLSLDGKLEAKAFDGDIAVEQLRVIDAFGVLPRLAADLRLRNLDLLQLTGAFSFGRIEGRLNGDVEGLRLLGWKPVAFKARLHTPSGDDSRHRISQRAIDNISSIGGGPKGLLSRGLLSVFDDFAYDRIGWSCVLENGICTMDGLEPKPGGGYVLVKGKWLPRIDVVGYSRRVNWDTLVEQLQNARTSQATTQP
jgi:hypothetical protein